MNRPMSVTVIAVINIILALAGVLGIIMMVLMRTGVLNLPTGANPAEELMKDNQAFAVYSEVSMLLGSAVTLIMLVANVGMLMMARWSRLVVIACAIYNFLTGILGLIIQHALITRPMLEQAESGDPQMYRIMKFGMMFGLAIGGAFLFYYAAISFWLSRRPIKVAFEGFEEAEFDDDPQPHTLS